ncbi:hypothetical protein [Chryseolinea lacunae]|uniref:ArsR family transcriptional regulator n=1 Tax=Chryseolinea lacunae TaxID=2801331 RepID=A0ABS1KS47_9BACT|nr:hypothetical protein [Chryseolinea lacunae]MBL0742308.1 hypothetical protein [Chryseolinea lacunae]
MDSRILDYLKEPMVKKIFRKILSYRLLSFYQLQEIGIETTEIKMILRELEQRGLIQRQGARYSDFSIIDKYYPTKVGLDAERQAEFAR